MIPFFDIHATHAAVANELKDAFARVLASGHIIMGSELEKFETEFAAYCGSSTALALAMAWTLWRWPCAPGA